MVAGHAKIGSERVRVFVCVYVRVWQKVVCLYSLLEIYTYTTIHKTKRIQKIQ